VEELLDVHAVIAFAKGSLAGSALPDARVGLIELAPGNATGGGDQRFHCAARCRSVFAAARRDLLLA